MDCFAQAFADTKDELKFLVLSKSAVTTTATKNTLDQVSAKVDKVIAFLEKMSPEERKVIEAVQQRSEAAVIEVKKPRCRYNRNTHFFHRRTKNLYAALHQNWDRRSTLIFAKT